MKTYRGIIRAEGTSIYLDAGGVIVRLEGDPKKFTSLNGMYSTITGEQQGDVIRNAEPISKPEFVSAESNEAQQFEPVIAAIKAHGDRLRSIPGVFGVRPGFRTSEDGLNQEPVIVVLTKPFEIVEAISEVGGIPIEMKEATALELVDGTLPLSVWEGILPEAAPHIGYKPPDPDVLALKETKVNNITCHIGPDSGWTTLKPFLQGTTAKLTVAMYEFYADHIIDVVTKLGEETDASLNMILQVSANDKQIQAKLEDSWQDRVEFTKASVSGPNRIFNNSYHTKVAVRDSNSFWLSSGNWSPLSQPLIEPGSEQVLYSKGNREWHVIIENETLAQMFEKFIEYDIELAREAGAPEAAPVMPDLLIPATMLVPEAVVLQDHPFVPETFAATGTPVRVKPLMSPDNYAVEVLQLINDAEQSLYLQFSYINQPSTEKFDDIISAISQKMEDGLDVRILVGSSQKAENSDLLIGRRGWKRSMFRKQKSKIHNKGILIDGKIAVVGSNNWSSDGTQYNRDASLIFFSRPIAQYFTEVFLFDWDNLSRPITSQEEVSPILAPESGPTPLGMVRIPWQAWFDE